MNRIWCSLGKTVDITGIDSTQQQTFEGSATDTKGNTIYWDATPHSGGFTINLYNFKHMKTNSFYNTSTMNLALEIASVLN